ncbi:MAG: VanZ family protein [Clostridiales bacterium]|nr:VanZ family protein [Clostridiales bacterium]
MGIFSSHIKNALLLVLIALLFYIPARVIKLKKLSLCGDPKTEIIRLAFVIYCFALAGGLLSPASYGIDSYDAGCYLYIFLPDEKSLNIIPFYTISRQIKYSVNGAGLYPGAFSNLIANLFILMPLPLFMHALNKNINSRQCLLICFFAIAGVEFIQYFIGRAADIDDIILNMCGAVIGVLLYEANQKKKFKKSAI